MFETAVIADAYTMAAGVAAIADRSRSLVLGYANGTIRLLDPANSAVQHELDAGPGRVWSLATSSTYVAAACGDGSIRVWSIDHAD